MALFTHEDDLRFRRTTWLLSKLQAIGPRSEDPSLPDADAALQQLSSLANLFVRQHEVVAVIPAKPTAAPSQQDLYVTAQMEDEDEGHLENVIGGSVVDVKELDTVPSRDEVIASSITNFQQHVQTVFSFLKQAASLNKKLGKMKEDGQDNTDVSSQYSALRVDLQFYITGTCFQKISTRAGYHCAALDSKDPDEDQGQRSGGQRTISPDYYIPCVQD
jgi:hypothetical protein